MTKEEKVKAQQGRAAFFGEGVQGLRNRRKKQFAGWLLLAVALLVTLIVIPKGGLIPDYHSPGDIASRDIKSPRDLLVEDVQLTAAKRKEAANSVQLVYEFDPLVGSVAVKHIQSGLELLLQRQTEDDDRSQEELFQQLEADFGVPMTSDELRPLLDLPLSENLTILAVDLLRPIFSLPIVADLAALKADQSGGLTLVERNSGKELELSLLDRTIPLNEALQRSKDELSLIPGITPLQLQTLVKLVQQQLRPNLIFNEQETENRRLAAREKVAPVLFQVKKGEMVIREGERISADQILKLRAIRNLGQDNQTLKTAVGLLTCIVLLISIGYSFARRNISKFNPDSRDLLFLTAVLLSLFIFAKVSIIVSTGLANTFAYLDSTVYFYAIPFALGAMLVRIVLNSETALLYVLCFSVLIGILFGNSLMMTFYALGGSLVGAHGVRHCQTRSTLYRAGLWVGLANMGVLLGSHFLLGHALELDLLWKLCAGFFGGLLSAVFVNGTIPLVETFFKYTTDIKLLELANMNSPILRQLMTEAPGTYHHSILVGNLAESAAESINANPLLVRVAAYYHDIGKIRKPLYFIENAGGQRNKHDKLAPSMSALILTSHVKDGVELAREHRLGAELIDIIQQHHGTTLIKFFYDRAKNQADPGVQQVDERDYRYHGPKPQTREAALIMLADAVEAASRTLADPTPARIQGMVKKLINNIFIDGQLNECDLTLKDLNLIAKSFNRVLSGSFHQRVDYPEPVHIVREKPDAEVKTAGNEKVKLKSANPDRKPAEETKDPEAAIAEGGSEDLRRLGMS